MITQTNQRMNQSGPEINDSFFDTLIELIQSHEDQLTKQNDEIKEQNEKLKLEVQELKQNVSELNAKIDELQDKKKNAPKHFKMYFQRNQDYVKSLQETIGKYEKLSENLQNGIQDIKNILKPNQE